MINGSSSNCCSTSGMLPPSTRIFWPYKSLNNNSSSGMTDRTCNSFSILIRKYNIGKNFKGLLFLYDGLNNKMFNATIYERYNYFLNKTVSGAAEWAAPGRNINLAGFFIEYNRKAVELRKHIAIWSSFCQYELMIKETKGFLFLWKHWHNVQFISFFDEKV